MKHKFKNGAGDEVEISQTTRKDWLPYLVLVLTNPHRLLGICTQDPAEFEDGQPFDLEYACVYASQIGFQPVEGKQGMRIMGNRLVIPFDGVAPFRYHRVFNYTGLSWLDHEPDDSPLRTLLVEGYLNLFDASQLVRPGLDLSKAILDS